VAVGRFDVDGRETEASIAWLDLQCEPVARHASQHTPRKAARVVSPLTPSEHLVPRERNCLRG
jgi:hypothetical protein